LKFVFESQNFFVSCFFRDFFPPVSQSLLAVGSLTRRQLAGLKREGNRDRERDRNSAEGMHM